MGGFFGPKGGVSVTINFQEKFFQKGVLYIKGCMKVFIMKILL
jgi:hypothetical protein